MTSETNSIGDHALHYAGGGLQPVTKDRTSEAWFTWDNDLIMTVFSYSGWVVCVKMLCSPYRF